jgi:membrane protein YqaA with SNARE-associated domain
MATADDAPAEAQTSPRSPAQSGRGSAARGWGLRLARAAVFAGVVALSIFISVNREQAAQFRALGYPGIFILSFLASATIVLPAPGLLPVLALGSAGWNVWQVGLAAGAGSTLGEMSGYLAGFSGQAVIENQRMYDRLVAWMQRYGMIIIFILAVIPSPLFDLAGLVSGALRVPLWRFLFVTFAGKTVKMVAVAYLGREAPDLLRSLGIDFG